MWTGVLLWFFFPFLSIIVQNLKLSPVKCWVSVNACGEWKAQQDLAGLGLYCGPDLVHYVICCSWTNRSFSFPSSWKLGYVMLTTNPGCNNLFSFKANKVKPAIRHVSLIRRLMYRTWFTYAVFCTGLVLFLSDEMSVSVILVYFTCCNLMHHFSPLFSPSLRLSLEKLQSFVYS